MMSRFSMTGALRQLVLASTLLAPMPAAAQFNDPQFNDSMIATPFGQTNAPPITRVKSQVRSHQPRTNPAPTQAVDPSVPKSSPADEGLPEERVNDWTIGIGGGLLHGSFIQFASEMATVLDDPPNLRVLPIVSYGGVGNVSDLLYLKGIDVAITQVDVLDHVKRGDTAGNIPSRLNYLSRFYVAEVHIFARPEIKTVADLAGKKVSLNHVGSSANLTGGIVLDRLGVSVDRVYVNNSVALEKMRTGEIAAIIQVEGKPNELLIDHKPDPGFHFLPIEFTSKFKDFYVPVELTSEDYPNLIPKGEQINSIGVSTVLAVYNWPKGSDRHRRLTRFVDQLFAKFEHFQSPPFQSKWREINLAATVPGWTRYPPAEDALKRAKPSTATAAASTLAAPPSQASSVDDEQERFEAFLAKWQRGGSKSKLTPTERDAILKEFRALNGALSSSSRAPP
jgi:hypothetical protein